jgi:hypothetical protein
MRFRAKISHEKIAFLWNHLASLDKIGKEVVLLLSATSLRFSVFPKGEAVMQYTCVPTGIEVFDEFRVESQSDVIALQMQVDNLQKAMKAGLDSAEQIVFKLCKRGASPYLMVEFREPSSGVGGGGSTTTQDIPVKVLSPMETAHYDEPRIGATLVRLFLPTATKMSAVLDRMKGIAKHVWITAEPGSRLDENKKASLTLSVGSEAVSMQTLFPNLPVAFTKETIEGEREEEESLGAKLLVGTRDLSRVVKAIAMHPLPSTWLLCILAEAIVLNCAFEDGSGTTTYILAATDSEVGSGGAVPVSENLGQEVSVEGNNGEDGGDNDEDRDEEEFQQEGMSGSKIFQNVSRVSMTGAGGSSGLRGSGRPSIGASIHGATEDGEDGEGGQGGGMSRLSVTHGDIRDTGQGDSRMSRSELGISVDKSAINSRR